MQNEQILSKECLELPLLLVASCMDVSLLTCGAYFLNISPQMFVNVHCKNFFVHL